MAGSDRAEVLFQEAAAARDNREYSKAEHLQQEGLALWGRQDLRFSLELRYLAGIHFIQEKFDKAAGEYERALKIREELDPEDYIGLIRLLYWLGKSHFSNQKYDLAETAMRRALALAETHHDSPEDLARSLYELGFLLYYVGRYQEAEPFLLKALPLFESAKGPSDPETIQASERIALNYDNCPEIGKDPEPYFRRAVEAIAPDGEMRKTYIENLCRWADYVARRRRFEEADQLFAQLLSLITDPNKASDLTLFWMSDHCVKYFRSRGKAELVASLADVYRNYDAYGEMVKNQSEHAEQTLAEDDPAFAEAIFNSANLALFNEKYDEAQSLLDRALTAYTKIGGDQSERVAHVLCRICVVNRLMKKFDASEAAIQRALDITKRLYVDRYVYPSALENLALLREAEGKIAEATELYERAVSEYERTCGFASHDAAEGTYRQSGYLFRIQSFDLAETKIRRAISVMDGIDSLSDYDRSDYVATLSSILEAKGQMEEATGMRKRAEALYRRAKEKSETEEDDP